MQRAIREPILPAPINATVLMVIQGLRNFLFWGVAFNAWPVPLVRRILRQI